MPHNNTLFPAKSNANIHSRVSSSAAKAQSSKAVWQFAIFLSLAIVLQAGGFNQSVGASSSDDVLDRESGGQAKFNLNRMLRSTFLPRILSMTGTSAISEPEEVAPEQFIAQTEALAPFQPIAQSQKLILANTKSLGKPEPLIHQVKRGETITAIASEYQISSNDLVRANQITNSNVIFVNQRLTIPVKQKAMDSAISTTASLPSAEYQAFSNNTPTNLLPTSVEESAANADIARLKSEIEQQRAQYAQKQTLTPNSDTPSLVSTADSSLEQSASQSQPNISAPRTKLNSSVVRRNLRSNANSTSDLAFALPPLLNSEEYLPSAFDGYTWPAQGVVTSGYGWRWGRLHRGLDIAAPIGTPIVAAAAGTVIGSGWHGGYGNLVKLEHLDGSVTYYAHNNRILVTHGQKVKQGEQIAEMGSTGRSTGSHLHFEVHLRDKRVADPLAFLGARE